MNPQPHESPPGNPTSAWIQRQYGRITAGMGALLLVLAALAPFITPAAQRGTVAIITVLFGFAGALSLLNALSTRQPTVNAGTRAVIGLVLGALIALAGLIAPFALSAGEPDADTRFLLMLGYAPVALSGGLIASVAWRSLRVMSLRQHDTAMPRLQSSTPAGDSIAASFARVITVSGGLLLLCAVTVVVLPGGIAHTDMLATASGLGGVSVVLLLAGAAMMRARRTPVRNSNSTRRAPVARVPGGMLYRVVVPSAIVLILVLIVAVIGLVAAGTLTPLLK